MQINANEDASRWFIGIDAHRAPLQAAHARRRIPSFHMAAGMSCGKPAARSGKRGPRHHRGGEFFRHVGSPNRDLHGGRRRARCRLDLKWGLDGLRNPFKLHHVLHRGVESRQQFLRRNGQPHVRFDRAGHHHHSCDRWLADMDHGFKPRPRQPGCRNSNHQAQGRCGRMELQLDEVQRPFSFPHPVPLE